MTRCLSCGTTNSTKHPIVPRNFLPACQAVAIGPAANSMHAHVRLAVCQASSVPSARLRACYRNPICRLSGNPSVGVSSSIILWQKKQESAKHPHTSSSISSFNLRFRIIGHRRTLRNHLVRIHISNTPTFAKSRVFFCDWFPDYLPSTITEKTSDFLHLILARPFSLGRPYLSVVGCSPFHHPCRQHGIKTDEVSSVRPRCPVCLPNHRVLFFRDSIFYG